MRLLVLLAFGALAIAQSDQAPAELRVTAQGGSLSYEVVNLSPYRIVEFQVYTQFTSGGFENLGCGVTAAVKATKDLALQGVCRLPRDSKTGQPVSYSTRLVRVEFANGLKWTPGGK